MKVRRIRLISLLVGLALVGTAVAGMVVMRVVVGAVAEAGVDAAVVRRVTIVLVGTVVVVAVVVALGTWMVGRVVTRALRETATALASGQHADPIRPRHPHWLAEIAELTRARERLTVRLTSREAELEREEEGRRVLLDTLSEGILQLDAAGRVVRSNAAARTLFGLAADAHAQPFSTQIRSAELRRILNEAAAGRVIEAVELALDDRRLLISVRPLPRGANGAPAGGVVGIVDLTELRRLEGVRRDFVANVSHELKTPLTSIRGYVETLLADDIPDGLRQQFLEVIRKNADRLQRIVDDLLDLSRLQSGGWEPDVDAVDASEVIDDVWSACRDRAQRRGIVFVPPADRVTVLADPGGLRQILSNLIDNALRYTPDGGRIEISATATSQRAAVRTAANGNKARPGFVTFAVTDNGSGIPSEALSRVFERFYRVDPARSRADGGTGLGLSIVKHLVERMGGDVRAESTLGKGTTIKFRLPAAS
jgi:two-component system phosphate regulon sensor histidine kinase PhoR